MTAPGVGAVVALTYRATVDQPQRFFHSREVGAHVGLTPRRHQSGEIDYDAHALKQLGWISPGTPEADLSSYGIQMWTPYNARPTLGRT